MLKNDDKSIAEQMQRREIFCYSNHFKWGLLDGTKNLKKWAEICMEWKYNK